MRYFFIIFLAAVSFEKAGFAKSFQSCDLNKDRLQTIVDRTFGIWMFGSGKISSIQIQKMATDLTLVLWTTANVTPEFMVLYNQLQQRLGAVFQKNAVSDNDATGIGASAIQLQKLYETNTLKCAPHFEY